jgi:DNA polymerase-3 subunit delta'
MAGMWQGIEGHDAVVEHFRRMLGANRLASTYLFVGPEGIGKRAFALKFAQTLLCTQNPPSEMNLCGQCESCRLALSGNHPDLDVVSLAPGKRFLAISQFIGERDSRNQEGLCHNIAMRPLYGPRRVAIVDDADWFNSESANCLLKTLEEPPPGAVIILIGTTRSRQLPTILSRAQIVTFRPLADDVLAALILSEGLATDAEAAARLAERAHGSLQAAREQSDAALWEMGEAFIRQWDEGTLEVPRLIRDVEEFVNNAGKELDARRRRLRQLLNLVSEALGESVRIDPNSAEADVSVAAIDRCLEAEAQLHQNVNQSTLLEAWIDDLALLSRARFQAAAR